MLRRQYSGYGAGLKVMEGHVDAWCDAAAELWKGSLIVCTCKQEIDIVVTGNNSDEAKIRKRRQRGWY
jgi:hypothetical protein